MRSKLSTERRKLTFSKFQCAPIQLLLPHTQSLQLPDQATHLRLQALHLPPLLDALLSHRRPFQCFHLCRQGGFCLLEFAPPKFEWVRMASCSVVRLLSICCSFVVRSG